jgi:hypothetical protein
MSTPGGPSAPWQRRLSTSRGGVPIWLNSITGVYVLDTGQSEEQVEAQVVPVTSIDVNSLQKSSRSILSPKVSKVKSLPGLNKALEEAQHSESLAPAAQEPNSNVEKLVQVLILHSKCSKSHSR